MNFLKVFIRPDASCVLSYLSLSIQVYSWLCLEGDTLPLCLSDLDSFRPIVFQGHILNKIKINLIVLFIFIQKNTFYYTVKTRKKWNRKTTLLQYLCVFNVVTKQIVLLDTYQTTNQVKWVCLHSHVSHVHWTFKSLKVVFLFHRVFWLSLYF